ncbi:helix-turn-helix domain-containing protein [Thermodesulfobacteriota bacterium]
MSEKELLTADETAQKLSVTRRTILRWARENKIESVRISKKKILFRQEEIDGFLKSKTNVVELPSMKHEGAGRKMTSPIPKKGGDRQRTGESWRDLRQEVSSWES